MRPQVSRLLLKLRINFLGHHLIKAPNLQVIGGLQDGAQLGLGDVDLAPVHVVDDGLEVSKVDIPQDDDGVLTGVVHEQLLEVGAAS